MNYTKTRLGAELVLELERGYNVERIARWADEILYKNCRELDTEVEKILYDLSTMCCDEQFVWSEHELKELAVGLIRGS